MSAPIQRPTPDGAAATERVREICSRLVGVEERLSHGEATWFVSRRSFAMMADHHHGDRVAVHMAAREGVQEQLVSEDPSRFFRPPYVGSRGWIGVYVDRRATAALWRTIHELLYEAWDLIAAPSVPRPE